MVEDTAGSLPDLTALRGEIHQDLFREGRKLEKEALAVEL